MLGRLKRNNKSDEQVIDVLDVHANNLLVDQDTTDRLIETYGASMPMVGGLLRLARRLYATLLPVEPSPEFVTGLERRLMVAHQKQARALWRWADLRDRALQASRLLGAAISVLAMLAVVARVLGSVIMLVWLLIGRNRRRTTAPA